MNMALIGKVRALILALGAPFILIGVGCKTTAPATLEYHVGDPAGVGPLTFNVVETRWKSQLDAFPTPRIPERNFLLVRVVVTNGGGTEMGIPFLKLENSKGETFIESENGGGVEHWLGLLRRISPAQTEDGWLLFDVPTNAYKLRVTDGAIENEHFAYIDIPLNIEPQVSPLAPKL
jgi:hypothetical protein